MQQYVVVQSGNVVRIKHCYVVPAHESQFVHAVVS